MKILIVNSTDINGGAARAAYRLHCALLSKGIESKMLVQSKTSDDFTVIGPATKFKKVLAKILPKLDSIPLIKYKKKNKTLFSPAWLPVFGMVQYINKLKPDIVHLHWINGGMLRPEDLKKIKAPIVWSLHDNWAFTGGCHIKWECEKYKKACGACPRLGSNKVNDLSRKVFNRKKKVFYKVKNITIICVSKWLRNCAKESSLFRKNTVINLPNLINTSIFTPIEKEIARKILNLPLNKKLILFGAISAISDINKGFNQLSAALMEINSKDTELVVFGSSQPKEPEGFKQKVHYFGYLHDDVTMRILYCAANVTVVPSLQEAFGQIACESMSCGTPVVAFSTTGLLDIVDHLKNGYLARPFCIFDLAKGIDWILNTDSYGDLCNNAREKVLSDFDSNVVITKYINLYNTILENSKVKK